MTQARPLQSDPLVRFGDLTRPRRAATSRVLGSARLHYTYNGRGAIYQLLEGIPASRGDSVLVPGFHCTSMIDPVLHAGYRPEFYRIKRDLSVDHDDLRRRLRPGVAAVIIV